MHSVAAVIAMRWFFSAPCDFWASNNVKTTCFSAFVVLETTIAYQLR